MTPQWYNDRSYIFLFPGVLFHIHVHVCNTPKFTFSHQICLNNNLQYIDILGMDPCIEGVQNCDSNADCIPRGDQYDCECKTGFAGDGTQCTGTLVKLDNNNNKVMFV
jgi:hypothetical protein